MTENNKAIVALVKAQTEMGKALKDTKNPHFGKSYADLASVMSAAQPALNSNGFAIVQVDGLDDKGNYVDTKFLHESGEEFSSRIYLKIGKPDMQGYGSAQTYARRYGLMGLAGIAPEDDDGNLAAKSPQKQPPMSEATQQAREDGVLDGLSDNASPREKAEAYAKAIIADIRAKKSEKGLEGVWGKWTKWIGALQDKHSDLYSEVFDVYEEEIGKYKEGSAE